MGMIWKKDFNLKVLKEMSEGVIIKDQFFNQVMTLEQKDVEKWADCIFNFKFEYDDEWYLATFYEHETDSKVSLNVVKWDK